MCMEDTEFLHEEFHNMILKSQWVVLPAEDVAHLSGLCISHPRRCVTARPASTLDL